MKWSLYHNDQLQLAK